MKYRCEEIMCEGCTGRIEKALLAAGIEHKVELESKIVTIYDDKMSEKALDILDGLGFEAVEV